MRGQPATAQRHAMRIGIPAATGLRLSSSQRSQLYVLPQKAQIGDQRTYLSANLVDPNASAGVSSISAVAPAIYSPVSIREILNLRQRNQRTGAVAFVYPSHHFHAMPLENETTAALSAEDSLYFYPLHCAGSPFDFIVEGLLYLNRKQTLSVEQTKLLVTSLNSNIKSFVVCPRSVSFEPDLNELVKYTVKYASALLESDTAYEAEPSGWRRGSHKAIGKAVSTMVSERVVVWVDWFGSERYATTIVDKLKQWGLQREHIVQNQLHCRSAKFPSQFALVTVTPARDRIKSLGAQVARWTREEVA